MTHVDSASGVGNATGSGVESPEACGECSAFAELIAAAFIGRKMTEWTDARVLRRRHLEAVHPDLAAVEELEALGLANAVRVSSSWRAA